jgi:hypothetical protein
MNMKTNVIKATHPEMNGKEGNIDNIYKKNIKKK